MKPSQSPTAPSPRNVVPATEIERRRNIREAQRLSDTTRARLQPYIDAIAAGMPFRTVTEADYQQIRLECLAEHPGASDLPATLAEYASDPAWSPTPPGITPTIDD